MDADQHIAHGNERRTYGLPEKEVGAEHALRPIDPIAAESFKIFAPILHVAVAKVLDRMRFRRVFVVPAHFAVPEDAEVVLKVESIRLAEACELIAVLPCHKMIPESLRFKMAQKRLHVGFSFQSAEHKRLPAVVAGVDDA